MKEEAVPLFCEIASYSEEEIFLQVTLLTQNPDAPV